MSTALERLERSRRVAPAVATYRRFVEIDGMTQGGLLAIELFTTVIPLIVIGFSYFTGFAKNASVGDLFIRQLGLHAPQDQPVRDLFGSSDGLRSTWTVVGIASFLVWGIPMSITVAAMFAKAWRREPFPIAARLWRGALWFVVYLAMMLGRDRIIAQGVGRDAGRWIFLVIALLPVWAFWSCTPALLVRDGARGVRALALAGFAGVIIDGIVLPLAARIVFPPLLAGWNGFGPVGAAMTMMTWCGVIGTGWVVTACVGAVVWERSAASQTVVDTQVTT